MWQVATVNQRSIIMLSYKDFKLLHESLGSHTLGLAQPHVLGITGAMLEAKKKKMLGVTDEKPLPPEKPEGEEEEVDAKVKDDAGDEEEVKVKKPVEDEEEGADEAEKEAPEKGDEAEEAPEAEGEKLQFAKKKCGKMKKEEADWWNSVYKMLDTSSVNRKYDSGLTSDQQANLPGQPGFAPQTRIGGF